MTPEEYRRLVAETANRIFTLFEEARVMPTSEVAMAQGLCFAVAAKHAGISKEACLEALGDAYDNADFYMRGEMPPEAPVLRVCYVVVQTILMGIQGRKEIHLQTFMARETADDYVRALHRAGNIVGTLEIKELPIG